MPGFIWQTIFSTEKIVAVFPDIQEVDWAEAVEDSVGRLSDFKMLKSAKAHCVVPSIKVDFVESERSASVGILAIASSP